MIPRFCPRPSCRFHSARRLPSGWFQHAGTYDTRAFGAVPRFRCTRCGKYFSTQTFSIDYYSKRPVSYRRLFKHVITTSSIRDMARDFSVSCDVVLNKLSRLARNCLAVLQQLQGELVLDEDLCADGFESFTVSQYFPCHINLLAGARSQLLYCFDYVTLRRKGRMTDEQKRIRQRLEQRFRADPRGIERSFTRLYELVGHLICDGARAAVVLFTDKYPAYQRARKRHLGLKGLALQGRFASVLIDSRAARTQSNPLFAVNYLDRQIRKDIAEHVRETVCFGRNVSRVVDRMAVYAVYHNLYKPYREVRGDFRSHAEVAGVDENAVARMKRGMLSRRAFASKAGLEGLLRRQWLRQYVTPLKKKPEYLPLHALAM